LVFILSVFPSLSYPTDVTVQPLGQPIEVIALGIDLAVVREVELLGP
jgi:hypothetical protein